MKLYLMRHAEAENLSQTMMQDAERRLTEAGRLQARAAAEKLKEQLAAKGEGIDLVLTSPYVRTLETAEIAGVVLGLHGKVFLESALQPGADLGKIKQIEDEHRGSNLLLVGHEPDLGIIASQLLRLASARPLGKAEVVEIRV
jgi:phosphohistidine phosphatase